MKNLTIICAVALILAVSSTAQASLTAVVAVDTPSQDTLVVPGSVHELGNAPAFPAGELITSSFAGFTLYQPCPVDWNALGPANVLVSMTNLTGKTWSEVWYVADPLTSLTNDDGLVNLQLAFKIDKVGLNRSLLSESIALNDIFEPGETWEFVIQNYANVNPLGPVASSLFGTIGVPSAGDQVSSGSIIAVPAPGAVLLGSLGVSLVGWLRRRRTL